MVRRRSTTIDNSSLAVAFDDLRADYNAAKQNRYRRKRTGVSASGSGSDYHYRREADYLRMMELSRDFFRNDLVVGQGVRRLVQNVIGGGFTLDARTGNPDLDRLLTSRWNEYALDADLCDLAGEHDFHEQEKLALKQTIVDGDLVVLLNRAGPLELVEAHRMRTPANALRSKQTVIHGVRLDENRRRLEYWLTKQDIDPNKTLTHVADIKKYAARDPEGQRQVLHIYRPDRVSQTRGVTALAPACDAIGMHDDIQFATLVRAQVASCFAILRELDMVGGGLPSPDPQRGERSTETLADGSTRTIEGVAPGMEVTGRPGEKLSMDSPNIPNPEFKPHALLILTFIAINLGLPLAVLLLDPSETNFSGWRGAMDQARAGFRELQQWLISRFHRPVYRWKVRQWLSEDTEVRRLAEGSAINLLAHRWNPPGFPYIEPFKDASADLLRTRNALISQRRRAAERGTDWDDLSTEIVEDNAILIRKAYEMAVELNKEFPELNVTWREVACLPTPDGVKISLDTRGNAAEENRDAA